jgi:hypothetical protein
MSPQHFPASLSSLAMRVVETHFSFAIFGFFDGGLDGGGDMDDESKILIKAFLSGSGECSCGFGAEKCEVKAMNNASEGLFMF